MVKKSENGFKSKVSYAFNVLTFDLFRLIEIIVIALSVIALSVVTLWRFSTGSWVYGVLGIVVIAVSLLWLAMIIYDVADDYRYYLRERRYW